jgi:hypothetical protein
MRSAIEHGPLMCDARLHGAGRRRCRWLRVPWMSPKSPSITTCVYTKSAGTPATSTERSVPIALRKPKLPGNTGITTSVVMHSIPAAGITTTLAETFLNATRVRDAAPSGISESPITTQQHDRECRCGTSWQSLGTRHPKRAGADHHVTFGEGIPSRRSWLAPTTTQTAPSPDRSRSIALDITFTYCAQCVYK